MSRFSLFSRSQLFRILVCTLVLLLISPAVFSSITHEPTASYLDFSPGIIEQPADGITIISIQGFHFEGKGSTKKPARLVAVDSVGNVLWVHNGSSVGARWFYDADPLPNGNIFVVATEPDGTLFYELDSQAGKLNWLHRLPLIDTHDADLIGDDKILIANMRNYNTSTNLNDDRLLIFNMTTESFDWEWKFRDHGFQKRDGGRYSDDWTHVNDIDLIDERYVMASIRNFDQIILIDLLSDEIVLTLGEDGQHKTMYEQHNPQYLLSSENLPTILVADSENDRVVEYEYSNDTWKRTWQLSGNFSWPRDADRLPNGNTLITDSLNHRVIEVTPLGKIVWEIRSPWGPYDAERLSLGDEASGSTLLTSRDLGITGSYQLQENSLENEFKKRSFKETLITTFEGTFLDQYVTSFSTRWAHVTPWIYPVWMSDWDFAGIVSAMIIILCWFSVELVYQRRRIIGYLQNKLNDIQLPPRP